MSDIYRICLFGHRDFYGHRILDTRLFELVKDIIEAKRFVEIYIGRNGEFDIYAASVIKKVQKIVDAQNSELVCVLPYCSKDIDFYSEYYDSVIIPEVAERSHPKNAIIKRNQCMIEKSDLVICYVDGACGGAYSAMKYALKINKKVVNLTDKI